MTPLQEYVSKNGIAGIKDALGISVFEHPTVPLVGFQYSQVDSPKTDPVVRWSRGTVLEKDTWKLIAQPMVRFFNYGENQADAKAFDWSSFIATEKADGSLCIVYFYANEWRINTSGSFGLCRYSINSDELWVELFWKTFAACGGIKENLDPEKTYIFEICTPVNKVIKMHQEPKLFFLTNFKGEVEASWEETLACSKAIGIQNVPVFGPFKNLDEIKAEIAEQAKKDPAFEGFVVRDKNNVRFKIKSYSYLALHHLHENGEFKNSRLIELALANEGDEVLLYLPQLEDKYKEIKTRLDAAFVELIDLWEKNKDIQDQKTFALSIKDCKFKGLLFSLRKLPKEAQTKAALKASWYEASGLIVKNW